MVNLNLTNNEWYTMHVHIENLLKQYPDNRYLNSIMIKLAENHPTFNREYHSQWFCEGKNIGLKSNTTKIYYEDDGYGIVGVSFICKHCNHQNRFVTSDEATKCEKCHTINYFSEEEQNAMNKY